MFPNSAILNPSPFLNEMPEAMPKADKETTDFRNFRLSLDRFMRFSPFFPLNGERNAATGPDCSANKGLEAKAKQPVVRGVEFIGSCPARS